MDATNANSTKGSGEGWINLNDTSSFGGSSDTAKAQCLNSQQENKFSTTSSIDSFCRGPDVRGGSAGSSTSFPGSSSAGASAQARTQVMMQHPGTNRFVEVSEDDQEPRSTMRSNGNDCAGKGMPSLKIKEDNTDNDKDASNRSSSSSNNNRGNESPSATEVVPSSDQDVAASYEGIKFYSVNDVLCGRGGGTNVHPGNRRFRDLVNANRRAYLKAKKNDKPTISRSIVRAIRQMNGRFLKKDEKKDLWFEIGDDYAREKTSQALRQRAPEMRKILLEDEQRQQQQQVVEQQMLLHRHQLSALAGGGMGGNFSQINALARMGGNFNPSAFSIDSQLMGQVGNVNNLDPSQSLLAKYNTMLQQKNWLAQQEQNMILQRLTMSGINPQSLNVPPQRNSMDSMATQALLHQGFNPVVTRGA